MKNATVILVRKFRVLLSKMVRKPKVVRDIVLTCVVLHNIQGIHQGGGAHSQNSRMTCEPYI